MTIYDAKINTLEGEPGEPRRLQGQGAARRERRLQVRPHAAVRGPPEAARAVRGRGFEVLGFPCNQFMGQEPGTADEIREFCDTNYHVTFPLFEKIDVNGDQRHPVYEELTQTADADGEAGDVKWNFEKFLVVARRQGRRAVPPAGGAGRPGPGQGDRGAASRLIPESAARECGPRRAVVVLT